MSNGRNKCKWGKHLRKAARYRKWAQRWVQPAAQSYSKLLLLPLLRGEDDAACGGIIITTVPW